jgi:hypothetical protein
MPNDNGEEIPIPILTTDKQLVTVDVKRALWKRDHGVGLNIDEFAVLSGYDYTRARKLDWIPRIDGKVFWDDFVLARRQRCGLLDPPEPVEEPAAPSSPGPATRARQRRPAAGRSDESAHRHGSRAASQSHAGASNGDTK